MYQAMKDDLFAVKHGVNQEIQRKFSAGKELEDDHFFKEYVKRVLQMDHSIFGNLMDINDDFKEESHYSQEEIYMVDDQSSNTQVPEGSVGEGYGSEFYPFAVHLDTVSSQNEGSTATKKKITEVKKNTKRRSKKKLTVNGKEIRFFCTQCDYRTWKKSNFQRHLGTHNKKVHKCCKCPYSSKYAEDLKKHLENHAKKETIQILDEKRFATLKDEVTIEPRWTYPVVRNNKEIKREIKEEAESYCPPVEVYLDEQSSNSCVPDSSLEGYDSDFYPLAVHIEIATPQNFKHPQLNSAQVSVNNDNREALLLKNNKELRYSCPYCSYRTWKTSNFQRHLCTHTNERPHKCLFCKYSGKHHEDLKKHMLCHKEATTILPNNGSPTEIIEIKSDDEETSLDSTSKLARFTCPLCDFKSTRSSMLYRHQRVVHNDHRPFACDLCPYRSKQRDSLKKHMMAHTDERPFECEICHHKCRQKGDLKRHKLLHSGERPFACPHCAYRSNRTQLLKKHISRRHTFPQIATEIPVGKTNLYEEFTGGHYLAEMF